MVREGTLISTRAIKAARAWVAQLGQRRSVEVAVPQGFAGSNPAPRIFDLIANHSDEKGSPSSADEPPARVCHEDREGEDRRLECAGPCVGQCLGDAHPFDGLDLIGIGAPVRRMTIPCEEHVQGALQVRREAVPGEHFEKTSGFVAGFL